MSASRLTRTQIQHDSGPLDGEESRVYFSHDGESPPMPSVTSVKALRVDPDKEDALDGWRKSFDGQSRWGRPWYKDQMSFKGHRGTLVHFAILNSLGDAGGDTYFHEVGEDDYGYEEYYSEYCLKKWTKKAPSANTDEVPHVPRNNQYDGEHAWDKAMRGAKWAARSFKQNFIDTGRIDEVLEVEEFVYNEDDGYAGQYDLLYVDADGRTVLCDLKTSSALRFDHKLQSAAYKRAIEATTDYTVDVCEVARLHPDSETVEISQSDDWDRTLYGLECEFVGLCDQFRATYQQTLDDLADELTT